MAPRATGDQPQYVLTLSDGTATIGIKTRNKSGVRRLPRSPGVERKVARQKSWAGGFGSDDFHADTSKFFDSQNVWTMVDGQAASGPFFTFSKTRTQNIGTRPAGSWTYSDTAGEYARSFVADGAMAGPYVGVFIRLDDPVAVTTYPIVRLRADSAGTPGTVLETVTLTSADFPHSLLYHIVKLFTVSLIGGTTYWVTVEYASPFVVALDSGTAGQRNLNLGGGWESIGSAPLFHVALNRNDWEKVVFFEYKRAMYFVGRRWAGTTELFVNGDRGVSTAGTITTLTDTTKTWATNEWAGAVLVLIGGPGQGRYSEIASNTATVITAKDNINAGVQSEYVILGSDKWTEITGHGLASGVNSVTVCNDIVYLSRFEAQAFRRMREYNNAGVWTRDFADDATHGTWLLTAPHWDTGELSVYSGKHVSRKIAVAPKQPWGTNLTFEADIDVPNEGGYMSRLALYNNAVWAGMEDSVFMLKNKKMHKVPIAMEPARDERNCVAIVGWNTNLYFNVHDGLERLYGQVVDDIGPNRGQGVPSDRHGYFRKLVPVVQFMFGAYDAGRVDGRYSSVLVTVNPGGDWHNIFTAYEKNQSISDIAYQAIPGKVNRLWLHHGRDIGFLEMPDDIHNAANDQNMRFAPHGYITTGWMDFETPELDHFFEELRLITRNLGGILNLAVDFKLNSDEESDTAAAWIPLTGGAFNVSPYQRQTINTDITGRRIRFRLKFRSDVNTPVILSSFELRANQMNEVLYDLHCDIRAEDDLMLMTGRDAYDVSAFSILNQFQAWEEVAKPLVLRFAGPGGGDIIDNIKCHIDPVSLLFGAWNKNTTKITGNLVLKQIRTVPVSSGAGSQTGLGTPATEAILATANSSYVIQNIYWISNFYPSKVEELIWTRIPLPATLVTPPGGNYNNFIVARDGSVIYLMGWLSATDSRIWKCTNWRDPSPVWTQIQASGDPFPYGKIEEGFSNPNVIGTEYRHLVINDSLGQRAHGSYNGNLWTWKPVSLHAAASWNNMAVGDNEWTDAVSTVLMKLETSGGPQIGVDWRNEDIKGVWMWKNLIGGKRFIQRREGATDWRIHNIEDNTDPLSLGSRAVVNSYQSIRGALEGAQVVFVDDNGGTASTSDGKLFTSPDGVTFTEKFTWKPGVCEPVDRAGGNRFLWAARNALNAAQVVRFSDDGGSTWGDRTGNLWSLTGLNDGRDWYVRNFWLIFRAV